MAINLHDKYAKQIQGKFTRESIIAGLLSNEYSWSGVRTVKVVTPQTVSMGDYQRSGTSRYGIPADMEDVVQEMTLTQDKSFSMIIDKGDNSDQNGIKSAGKMLALQIAERAIPTMDAYVLKRLANMAGNVMGNATALSKTNICDRISGGTVVLDDAEVPETGRTLLVSAATYKLLRLSEEFVDVDKLAEKSLAQGQVGYYDNMKVIKVPAGRWPKYVNFMIVYKNSATAPVKLNDTRLHQDPPGISGNLLEGRQYYDCFVFGAKAQGIYVEVNTASNYGTVIATPTIDTTTGALSCTTSNATIKYTTDGSDPRYSNTAKTGATSDVTTSGTVVKCYAYASSATDGVYPSSLATATLA